MSGFSSISCATAGTCSAGGGYIDKHGNIGVFVSGQKAGVWGKAQVIPGMAALNLGGVRVGT